MIWSETMTKQEQIEEITSIIDSDICNKDCPNRCPYCGGLSSREAENICNAGYRKTESVYESGLKVDCVRMPDGKVMVRVCKGNRACAKYFEVDRTPVAKGNWR